MESTKQIKIEIRNRWTGSVVFEYPKEGNTITETVLDAIRRDADLRDAKGCYLSCPTEGSFIGWKKAYGNAIVPQVALRIFETINEYELC